MDSAGVKTPEAFLTAAKSTMPTDPTAAGQLAQTAELLARKQPESLLRKINVATALWLQAESLQRLNKANAAAGPIKAAIALTYTIRPAIKLQGDLLQTRAGVEKRLGHPEAALEDYQRAYAIFSTTGVSRSQAVALQNIGLLYLSANDYSKVFYYYEAAKETYPNDALLNLSASTNIAGALYSMKRYGEAEIQYRRALEIAAFSNLPTFEIQSLLNVARTQISSDRLDAARATIAKALKLWQQVRIPDLVPLMLETRAALALNEYRSTEAVRLVEEALSSVGAVAVTQPHAQLQYIAYQAYLQAGDADKAIAHYQTFIRLDNEGRALADSTNAALSAARFNFVNQNARIATLKAGQLQRDIAFARYQARQNFMALGGLLLIAILIVTALVVYLRVLRRSRDTERNANTQLTLLNTELNSALAAKTEFLSTTSHEIRTPLNGILGMTQVLLADPGLTGVVRERIMLMHGSGETLRALVDDILDFAKMSDSKLELHPLETDFPKLLDDVVNFWRDRATEAGLTLVLDRTDVPARVIIDSRRLRQILANLLSNAIKFTSEGGVTVTVTTITCIDQGPLAQPGERLRIAVTDTGIGIASSDYSAVFEKFRQLEGSTTRRFGGTGLGLAISRMIAHAMDGDIDVESMVDAGSTFTLDLPLARAAAAAVWHAGERPSSLAEAQMLLVGATPMAQGVLRAVLTPRVANFAVATNIAAAFDQVTIRSVDLMVIDMPKPIDTESVDGLDGAIANLTEVVSSANQAGIVVAVLWPSEQHTEHARLLAAGAAAVIGKPVTSTALLQKLSAIYVKADNVADKDNVADQRKVAAA